MTEEYKPTNRQRISNLEGLLNGQQQSIRRLFEDMNLLKATALDHGQRFYRYGELEAQLITRMDALENPPDVKEPEEVPVRGFPCCDRADGHDEQTVFEMDPRAIRRYLTGWCPARGRDFKWVEFREPRGIYSSTLICLGCGAVH